MKRDDFAKIGFYLPEGLPNKEYALSDGLVSVILDQSGGLNMIEYQGPRRTGARRGAFFSNGIWRRRPDFFPEPVIEFRIESAGRSGRPGFANLALCPYGVAGRFEWAGQEFERRLWIKGPAVMMEWRTGGTKPARISLEIREKFLEHLNEHSAWEEPSFDPQWQALRYNILRNFIAQAADRQPTERRHEACSMVGAAGPADWSRRDGRTSLSVEFDRKHPARFFIVFAEDVHRAAERLSKARSEWPAWYRQQRERYRELAGRVPALKSGQWRMIPEIIRTAPLFLHSTRCEKNESETAFRPSTRGYWVHNAWDGQFACRVINACGDTGTVRRYLNFINRSRGPNGAVIMTCDLDYGPAYDINLHHPAIDRPLGAGWNVMLDSWAIENLHEYYFRTGDRQTLRALYPYAATALTTIAANAGPTGLVESCFGGTDYSEQTNRPRFEDPRDNRTLSSRLSGVEDIGLLFHACQQGAELAGALNDEKLLKTCLNLSRRIEAGFMGHFFDAEEGFFIDCVWPKDKPVNRNRTFRLTSLLALSGHGELLSLDEWDRLADFIVRRLGHPVIGLRECPADQPMHPTGRNRSENWFQNASRETFRLARLSGNQELLRILLEKAEFFFGAERVLRENLYNNQATQFFDASRLYVSTSWWQCMTTASWWLGLLEALAGIRLTQGNLEYLPGDGGSDVRLTNLFYGGRVWEVDVRGRGRFVAGLEINGRPFDGTQQLEAADERPEQRVRIEKTNRPPVHPVVLGAGAARARITRLEPGRLEAGLAAPGYCRLWFYSPEQPRLLVDGRPIRFAWSPKRHEGTAGFRAGGDSRLEIRCPAAGRRP